MDTSNTIPNFIAQRYYEVMREALDDADDQMRKELDDNKERNKVVFTIKDNNDGSIERVMLLEGKRLSARLIKIDFVSQITLIETSI